MALAIGVAALVFLATLGFAIWVFIPLIPAGLLLVISLAALRRKHVKPQQAVEAEPQSRKAA